MKRVILVVVLAAVAVLTAVVPAQAQANGLSVDMQAYAGQHLSIPAEQRGGERVEDWVGTVVQTPRGAQFDDYFVRQSYPGVRYGIAAADERLEAELVTVRATGQVVRIWGYLRTGVPDVNGTQILVKRIKLVEAPLPRMVDLTPLASVSASSVYPPDRGGSYEPDAVIDGQLDTPWVEAERGIGRGAWLELSFDRPVEVNALVIDPGYDRSSHLFYANNRLKRAVLVLSDGEHINIDMGDRRGMQRIILARAPGGPIVTTSIRLVIDDVYRGRLYNDTCIGEIQVWGRLR